MQCEAETTGPVAFETHSIEWVFSIKELGCNLDTVMPLNPEQAAMRQVARLGYAPADVRHIVLTHIHFDHCGGLPDFPAASVHVHRREYKAFTGCPRR